MFKTKSAPNRIGNDELEFLHNTIVARGIRRMVEIGSWCGKSTWTIANALLETGGHLITIDPHSDIYNYPKEGIINETSWRIFLNTITDTSNVSVMRMKSVEASAYISPDARLDAVFIDGDHSYDGVKADAVHWSPRTNFMLFHDHHRDGGQHVMAVVSELLNSGWHVVGEKASTIAIEGKL